MFTLDGGVVDPARERLAAAMNRRRLDLGIRWREVAQRAGMTEQNLIKIRKGVTNLTEDAGAAIERALRWQAGSVAAVIMGDEPVESHAPDRPTRPGIENATPEQLVEMRQIVEDVMGPDAADEFLRKAIGRRSGGQGHAAG
jgi:transcriptional regulator with XRE-family HTH domain